MPMDRNKYSSYVNAPKYMMGPSMAQSGLYDALAQQLAGSSPAVGGIGAAGGMGTAESAMSGPAGMLMALPMQYLSGMHNQAQDAINAFTGTPSPIRKNPMSQIGAFLDQFTNKQQAPAVGTIGQAQNDFSSIGSGGPIGTLGAIQSMSGSNPGAMATLAGMMFPGSGHAEPDADDKGGPSDRDADNGYISGVPNNGTVSSGFSKALGGLKGPDTGMLAGALKSAAENYPTERATGRMSSGAFVGGPVNPTSMGGSPSASSMMGQRPQPKLMGQDYQLGDYTLPQRKRTTGFGGGF